MGRQQQRGRTHFTVILSSEMEPQTCVFLLEKMCKTSPRRKCTIKKGIKHRYQKTLAEPTVLLLKRRKIKAGSGSIVLDQIRGWEVGTLIKDSGGEWQGPLGNLK